MKSHCLVIALCLVSLSSLSQGRLEESKSEVKKEKTSGRSETSSNDSESTISSGIAMFFGKVIMYVTYGSVIGIYHLEDHLHNSLTLYPYEEGTSGDYLPPNEEFKKNTKRIDVVDNFLIGDDLYGNHLKLKVRPTQYFYIQLDYTELLEPKQVETGFDNLSLFDLNFSYDRVRMENFSLGWMLGARYIANEVNEFGFTYGLQMEYFTDSKFSLYSSVKGGYVNESKVNEFEVSGRYHFKRVFASVGYERIQIATPVFNFLALGLAIYL